MSPIGTNPRKLGALVVAAFETVVKGVHIRVKGETYDRYMIRQVMQIRVYICQ
jgi:hypothetical protein